MDPQPAVPTGQHVSFFHKHIFSLGSFAILLIALVFLVVLGKTHSGNPSPAAALGHQGPQPLTTPTPALTQVNLKPTLDATNQDIQSTINQSQTETTTAGQIDSSSDNTLGL